MRTVALCLVSLAGFTMAPRAGWAQCNPYPISIADGRITEFSVPNTGDVGPFFRGTSGRSYSVELVMDVEIPSGASFQFGAADEACPSADASIYRDITDVEPGTYSGIHGERKSFTATVGDAYYVVRVINNTGATRSYRYSVSDTTLYSPAWSTNGSFDTFYRSSTRPTPAVPSR